MKELEATRYMRKPFFPEGFTVDGKNMEKVALWCNGRVVGNAEASFIWVPVENARRRIQSEAYVGDTILRSWRGDRFSYKVYKPEWLQREFIVHDDLDSAFVPLDKIEVPDDYFDKTDDGEVTQQLIPRPTGHNRTAGSRPATNPFMPR